MTPVPSDRARERLKTVFGFDEFRPGQEEILRAVLAGEDVLAVMPTGSGKSLCYQLPAVVRDGLTVVVSPLIALMRDQVRQLNAYGVEAAALNSGNDAAENRRIERAARDGTLRLLYVAPERALRPDTVELLADSRVDLLAIDEAHCVSQWGHDFRPEYLRIGELRIALGGVPVLALTATADAPTRADIEAKLFAAPPRVFVRSFDRPNLRLAMRAKDNAPRQVLRFVADHPGDSGIVYCSSRKRVEEFAAMLRDGGHRALPYHAGMDKADRDANQDAFQREDGVVIVATVAFGMGIDKPDVRFVCHADLPSNVESYYQEIGRAGRDGLPADTLTLHGLEDMRLRRMQIEQGDAPDERKRVERQRLNALVALCEAPRCRRQTLLSYFGEASAPCGNCDLCVEGVESFDGTVEAQKIMSAIARTGQRFATEHVVDVVLGERTEQVLKFGHEALPTFGVGAGRPRPEWRAILRQLNALGLIEQDIVNYGRWTITDEGWATLRGRARVDLRRDLGGTSRKSGRKARQAAAAAAVPEADAALLADLKRLRAGLAASQNVPAYVVFADRSLVDMAARRPATLEAMRDVHGVGDAKLARYGAAFLEAIRARASGG